MNYKTLLLSLLTPLALCAHNYAPGVGKLPKFMAPFGPRSEVEQKLGALRKQLVQEYREKFSACELELKRKVCANDPVRMAEWDENYRLLAGQMKALDNTFDEFAEKIGENLVEFLKKWKEEQEKLPPLNEKLRKLFQKNYIEPLFANAKKLKPATTSSTSGAETTIRINEIQKHFGSPEVKIRWTNVGSKRAQLSNSLFVFSTAEIKRANSCAAICAALSQLNLLSSMFINRQLASYYEGPDELFVDLQNTFGCAQYSVALASPYWKDVLRDPYFQAPVYAQQERAISARITSALKSPAAPSEKDIKTTTAVAATGIAGKPALPQVDADAPRQAEIDTLFVQLRNIVKKSVESEQPLETFNKQCAALGTTPELKRVADYYIGFYQDLVHLKPLPQSGDQFAGIQKWFAQRNIAITKILALEKSSVYGSCMELYDGAIAISPKLWDGSSKLSGSAKKALQRLALSITQKHEQKRAMHYAQHYYRNWAKALELDAARKYQEAGLLKEQAHAELMAFEEQLLKATS